MTDDIEHIFDALHGDKKRVLNEQIKSIEEEIVERKTISARNTEVVSEEVHELANEVAKLRPEHENAPDLERKDRVVLEREKLDLTKELREERRDAWKDVQQLKREEREVEKELLGNEQRQRRTRELL